MFVEATLAGILALIGLWRMALNQDERAMLGARLVRTMPFLRRHKI
jgi:hypothetical protein